MPEDTINAGNYTPITQELREYIERHPTMMHAVGLTDLLDNIDAIHKAMEDEYAEMREFCNRLEDAAKKHEDVDLWGTRYIAGPVDSQGVPINFDTPIERWGALELIIYNMHDKCWYVTGHDMTAPTLMAEECTVVLPPKPTVEDVLWEFTRTILNQKVEYREQNIAKYAAKLRLAGDAE